MSSIRFSSTNLLIWLAVLSFSLTGCQSTTSHTNDVQHSGHRVVSTASLQAMAKGTPCYFRGEVDFCGNIGDEDGDGVTDDRDLCLKTPKGTLVNAQGCPLDTDGDGVLDPQDQCPNTPKGATVNKTGCWVLENLLFKFNKFTIDPNSYPLLERVVTVLHANPQLHVELQGHTDTIGSPAYNLTLSKQRAAAVMNYLIHQGIAADRLSSTGFGLTQPITTNETASGREANRRVVLMPHP